MYPPLRLRALPPRSTRVIPKLARFQTASARLVQRARVIHLASQGKTIPEIVVQTQYAANMARKWLKRFSDQG